MLRQRIITALLLLPLVIGGILYLDNPWFAVVLGGVMLLGADEMARLANLSAVLSRVAFVGLMAGVLWGIWTYLPTASHIPLLWLMSAWWVLTSLALLARRRQLGLIDGARPLILLLGGLVLATAWLSIVQLHAMVPNGPQLVLFLFILIWIADSGAYFAGRAFGRRKLSPFVSPGKTWEGAAGALVGAVCAGLLLAGTGWAASISTVALILLSLLVTMVSIGGDLWESRLKRESGVKDSGALLPGHGGVLDRIDSLLAAAPVFALGLMFLGEGA